MRVSDEQVRAVIAELRGQGARVSGARVRRELVLRFGARGGVSRIYRVLREAPAVAPAEVEALRTELEQMRQRAERAEAREDAHQVKWAAEVDALRVRVRELEAQVAATHALQAAYERTAMALRAAEGRLARMEEPR